MLFSFLRLCNYIGDISEGRILGIFFFFCSNEIDRSDLTKKLEGLECMYYGSSICTGKNTSFGLEF